MPTTEELFATVRDQFHHWEDLLERNVAASRELGGEYNRGQAKAYQRCLRRLRGSDALDALAALSKLQREYEYLNTAAMNDEHRLEVETCRLAEEVRRLRARPTHPPDGAIDYPRMVLERDVRIRELEDEREGWAAHNDGLMEVLDGIADTLGVETGSSITEAVERLATAIERERVLREAARDCYEGHAISEASRGLHLQWCVACKQTWPCTGERLRAALAQDGGDDG